MMRKFLMLATAALALAACNSDAAKPRIVAEKAKPAPAAKAPAKVARSEPIFYNGKTYQLDLTPAGDGYDLAVNGMGAKQEKDAVAVATSSLRYFACRDTQSSKVTRAPAFTGGTWKLAAKCV